MSNKKTNKPIPKPVTNSKLVDNSTTSLNFENQVNLSKNQKSFKPTTTSMSSVQTKPSDK